MTESILDMRIITLLFISLVVGPITRAVDVSQNPDAWFYGNSVRAAVFEEYIKVNRIVSQSYIEIWERNEQLQNSTSKTFKSPISGELLNKEDVLKSGWLLLAEQGDDQLRSWSTASKEILKISGLTRDELELFCAICNKYRKQIIEIRAKAYNITGKTKAMGP